MQTKISAQELYAEGIIRIDITICKSWREVLFIRNAKVGFALALLKCQTCMDPTEF